MANVTMPVELWASSMAAPSCSHNRRSRAQFAGLLRGLAQCDGATPRALVAEGKAACVTNRQ